jgi:hypothetical protein
MHGGPELSRRMSATPRRSRSSAGALTTCWTGYYTGFSGTCEARGECRPGAWFANGPPQGLWLDGAACLLSLPRRSLLAGGADHHPTLRSERPHRQTCQLPWRERYGSNQVGSRRILSSPSSLERNALLLQTVWMPETRQVTAIPQNGGPHHRYLRHSSRMPETRQVTAIPQNGGPHHRYLRHSSIPFGKLRSPPLL